MTHIRIAVLGCLLATAPAFAQKPELPAKSPGAKVTQTAGLTDITIDYSSPAVHGRKIWGALVPFDKLWRAGANLATKIAFSRDVVIDGKPVPAGAHALFLIPAPSKMAPIPRQKPHQPCIGRH